MADEQPTDASAQAEPSAPPAQKRPVTRRLKVKPMKLALGREQSTIQFPYQDLEAAITVARAMLGGGGVAITRDQLAGVMNLSSTSGNFVLKVATARLFGLLSLNAGKYELTDLGFNILDTDEKRQKEARAKAFLNVPLYKRAYDEFKGRQLPPRPQGLEQAFVKFGVAQKQRTNARIAFDKSASQAGFFPSGPDRLIEPIIGPTSPAERRSTAQDDFGDLEPAPAPPFKIEPDTSGLHPFIQGLLSTLPEPLTGWTIEGRAKWLQAAANIFDLIYTGSGEITIRAVPETGKTDEQK